MPASAVADPTGAPRKRSTSKTVLEWVILIGGALVIALARQGVLVPGLLHPVRLDGADAEDERPRHRQQALVQGCTRCTAATSSCSRPRRAPTASRSTRRSRTSSSASSGCRARRSSEKDGHVLHQRQADRRVVPARRDASATARRSRRTASRRGPLPADQYWVMGDNRGEFAGLAQLRPDRKERDRRPRVPAHLAAQPPRPALTRRRRYSAIHSLTVATMRSGRSQ